MDITVSLRKTNTLENQVLQDWRKTCDELNAITQKMLTTKWYRIFEQERLVAEYKAVNQRWKLLFDYCVKYDLFS